MKSNIQKEEPEPAFYWNILKTHKKYDNFTLGYCAKKILTSDNAGGNSIISEAISAELLVREFNANSIRTEMEVEYTFHNWKIADYTIRMYEKNVGVSVTRAMGFPTEFEFTRASADILLRKKINGLILARNGISNKDAFYTSILHIFCCSNRIKNLLYKAYKQLPPNLKDNIIILCTITDKCDEIYCNLANSKPIV